MYRRLRRLSAVGQAALGIVLILVAPMLGAKPTLGAQPTLGARLTLGDAIRQADQSAYANRVARGAAQADRAAAIAPLQGILPDIRVEGAYARTTDPIGVFGVKLRQRTITQADFDPARLNFPSAVSNYQSSVVLEQPLANADAWAGRASATHNANASKATSTWTMLSTRVEIVRAYYGAILASEREITLKAASRSAHAHLSQAEAMVRQGLVTRSDALLAGVRAGEMDADVADAEGGVETARRQLAVALGRPLAGGAAELALPGSLPSADRIRIVAALDSGASTEPRADIQSVMERSAAASSDAARARAAYLPRINSFVRYDWNAPGGIYTGERNWTVGVMATWHPFGTAAEVSDMRATAGRAAIAKAQVEGAEAQAKLDVVQTRIALSVALTRLTIAEQAVAQSAEAHRIVARKYAGGLATIVELLDAQATEIQSALGFSAARYNAIVAAAERRRSIGDDPGGLAALDERSSVGDGDPASALTSDMRYPQ